MKLNPIKLGDGIFLFKNVLKNPESTYQFILHSKNNEDQYFKWEKWLAWGNKAAANPQKDESYKTDPSYGAELQKECIDLFFEMIKIYKQNFLDEQYFASRSYDTNLPESYKELQERKNIGKDYYIEDFVIFEANKNYNEEWHMHPHIDMHDWWGSMKITFNCNIYVNSDYEGGEIVFCKNNGRMEPGIDSSTIVMEDVLVYKPEAGDALLIQTDVWHGVLSMKNNTSKYYIRQLLTAANSPEKNKYIEELGTDYEMFFEEENKKNQEKMSKINYKVVNYKKILENTGE